MRRQEKMRKKITIIGSIVYSITIKKKCIFKKFTNRERERERERGGEQRWI